MHHAHPAVLHSCCIATVRDPCTRLLRKAQPSRAPALDLQVHLFPVSQWQLTPEEVTVNAARLICLQALTLKMPGASSQRMLGCVALKVNQLDLHFQEINESITGRDREAHDGDVVADAVLFAGMERSDVGVFSSMSHGLRHDKALKLSKLQNVPISLLEEVRSIERKRLNDGL